MIVHRYRPELHERICLLLEFAIDENEAATDHVIYPGMSFLCPCPG